MEELEFWVRDMRLAKRCMRKALHKLDRAYNHVVELRTPLPVGPERTAWTAVIDELALGIWDLEEALYGPKSRRRDRGEGGGACR